MQAIGHLTGGIAHDFNNLLTVVLGNLEIIAAKVDPSASVQKRIERAAWAAQRGATLTSQLLAFARKQPLAPAAIDLSTTMPDLVPLLQRTLGETIEVRYVEGAGLWPAMADPAQLESAILNLALNARDAMPGGGRLTIELANKTLDEEYVRGHSEVAAGDYTMLAVSDTGAGMPPDVVARALRAVLHDEERRQGIGARPRHGVRLRQAVRRPHQDLLRARSGHECAHLSPPLDQRVARSLPVANSSVDLPRGRATILVVEDEAAVREIAVEILEELRYRVLQACDGEDGLRTFGAHASEVDLLLTDVVLPGCLRGRELAERIVAVRPTIKTLFMSGYTENSIVHHDRLDEGVQLIGKPFRREQLARKVAEALATATDINGATDKVVEFKPRRG